MKVFIIIALVLTLLYFLITHTSIIFMFLIVSGRSMFPTLNEGDKLTSVRSYLCKIKVGDIVVAKPYPCDDRLVIKRVAEIEAQGYYYYLLGDNPDESYDSRNYGWVSKKEIVAKVVTRKS